MHCLYVRKQQWRLEDRQNRAEELWLATLCEQSMATTYSASMHVSLDLHF